MAQQKTTPKYMTQDLYVFDERSMEPENTQPSLTEPNMSLTITQILERFSMGNQPSIGDGYYSDDDEDFDQDDVVKTAHSDLVDRQNKKANTVKALKDAEKLLKHQQDAQEKKANDEPETQDEP